jgi:transposase-like protein
MATPIFSAAHFQNEEAAFAYVEARVWPDGVICPRCGVIGQAKRLMGKTTRPGLWKCYACMKPFTVKVHTVMESSHIPVHVWLQAMHLLCSSKKGISSNQLHRTLGVTLKSAWFLSHRIREAMKTLHIEPMGGSGMTVEADETFIGRKSTSRAYEPPGVKQAVFALVQRGGGVRSFHVPNVTAATCGRSSPSTPAPTAGSKATSLQSTASLALSTPAMVSRIARPRNTSGMTTTPTPSRDISRSSNAASTASTST